MKITDQNYESYALDYIEGTLAGDARRAFDAFLDAHPERAEDIRALQFGMPVLAPDESVHFEGKAALRRHVPLGVWALRLTAAAAVVAVGIWIVGTNRQPAVDPVVQPTQVAVNAPVQPVAVSKPAAVLPVSEPATVEVAPVVRAVVKPMAKLVVQVPLVAVHRTEIVMPTAESILSGEGMEAQIAAFEAEIADFVPLPTETLAEASPASGASAYRATENERLGFLNLLSRNRMRVLAADIISPLSGLNPVRVYENDEERVVEFASIPVSRRATYQ